MTTRTLPPVRPAVPHGRRAHPLALVLACLVAIATGLLLPLLTAVVACLVMVGYGAHCAISRRKVIRDAVLPVAVALASALVVLVFLLPFSTH